MLPLGNGTWDSWHSLLRIWRWQNVCARNRATMVSADVRISFVHLNVNVCHVQHS